MSLLLKRRSRSETRAQPKQQETPSKQQQQPKSRPQQESEQSSSLQRLGLCPGMGRRKTSAELISEAKLFLGDLSQGGTGNMGAATATATMTAAGGARLVSTRRPITPREPGRVLYGKVALAGRPPSAFS